MKFLQKLGKALMLPVAVLPICGILMGIGYRLCPATMQGGDISGVVNLIGLFLVKAGSALIDNMALLFAIGVGVGMSEKNDGTGGIAALASWLMITTLLSTGVVTTIVPSIAESATKTLAFDKIENPFIGILAGIIGSACYNRFKDTKLPDWLSFFSGKRCVAIVSGVVSIVVSAVLLLVWPLLFGALVAIGKSIVSLDVVGAGIYAFLNRLLIPTGLHHALNNVFWFDTIGLGDLKHFWAGETSADVTWSLGMYMSGFFPCMMFGIPGAALAMVRCAKPAKKKAAIGLVASAAVCAFICGVTEPFEFGFMFLAPALYVIYALLYGIFTMITVALGFRAGFSFSAGAMDLLFSSSLPAAQKIWLIIPLGIAAFLVFYFVFLFAIKKWDLKTPGREDDDLEAEKKVELASDNYTAIAANKPLKVLITHGHVDHAMGANEFEEIYLNHKDKSVYQLHSEKGFRLEGAKGLCPEKGLIKETDMIPSAPFEKFHNLQEGDVFELGGIHVVIYELPGHTLGSVVMLIPEERTILLGDACNPFLFLFDKFSTGLASYEKNLRALQKKIAGKYDRVLISHGNGDSKPTTLEDVLKVCQDIRSGNVTDRNFVFSGETHPLADNGTYTFICYDKKRIEE